MQIESLTPLITPTIKVDSPQFELSSPLPHLDAEKALYNKQIVTGINQLRNPEILVELTDDVIKAKTPEGIYLLGKRITSTAQELEPQNPLHQRATQTALLSEENGGKYKYFYFEDYEFNFNVPNVKQTTRTEKTIKFFNDYLNGLARLPKTPPKEIIKRVKMIPQITQFYSQRLIKKIASNENNSISKEQMEESNKRIVNTFASFIVGRKFKDIPEEFQPMVRLIANESDDLGNQSFQVYIGYKQNNADILEKNIAKILGS